MTDAAEPRWGVMAVAARVSGRDEPAAIDLRRALAAGWEPFAVADGHIWLRKLEVPSE